MMITINNLTKTYNGNIHALRSIDLEIQTTGMFGLLGVNGAGKTTLMRILAGLLQPTGGTAHVFGSDISTRAGKQATKSLLGYLPQDMGVYPNLTAREFLDYIAILKGITDKATRQQDVEKQLARIRLTDVADRQIKSFSGGMKRRVGIAQAMLGDPRLVIVDEPTTGLDPEERIRVRNLLSEVAQTATVILSTHIVEDISHTCNDLAVLLDGKVVFRGTPADLIKSAQGKVWNVLSRDGSRPNGSLRLVSTLQLADGIQYRVLGENVNGYEAEPVTPSLEDGYMWLMGEVREKAST